MANLRTPRKGSMQYWPRKRAARIYPRVRYWANVPTPGLLGFSGYKVGMTQITAIDNRKFSKNKGNECVYPVTIVECPPLKILSVLFYKHDVTKWLLKKEIQFKADKELARKLKLSKAQVSTPESLANIDLSAYDDVRVKVYTQPRLTGIGKKKPEVFEIGLGGKKEDKLEFIKQRIGKDIHVNEVLKPGMQLDIHAVSKGKGIQGPVKRFGVGIRSHKAEKTIRGPGSLGPWCGQGHIMYRVAHAGQMGFHTRTEYNKILLKISDKPEEINPNGGFLDYGLVKSDYILIKGSIIGSKKRLVRLNFATRPNKNFHTEAPSIENVVVSTGQ